MAGPRNRFDRPLPQTTEYTDQKTRDVALEERWTYERDGTMSTLAFVSAHGPKVLVPEFMEWFSRQEIRDKEQAVGEWEFIRFGKPLDKATHGILLFQILDAFFPGRHWTKPPKPPDARPVPKDHSMPGLKMGRREIDARLMELERQKAAIGANDEPV